MSNIIQMHNHRPEPEWFGPYEIPIGKLSNGEPVEIMIDRNDDDEALLIIPETPYDGPVGYTLTDEQAAELTSALYATMSPAGRALFHQQLGETA